MPLVKFISPTDPRWLSTLDAIKEELVSDSLVYRYNAAASPDGLKGEEGTFSICSFWYVEALARAGRLDEARLAFEKQLTYANHLGLYSEEVGPTGEQLGQFPAGVHPPRADQRGRQPRPATRLAAAELLVLQDRGDFAVAAISAVPDGVLGMPKRATHFPERELAGFLDPQLQWTCARLPLAAFVDGKIIAAACA